MTTAEDIAKGGPRYLIRQCDVARDLGVGARTVARWMDTGQFPFVVVAGRRMVTKELYQAWLFENTEPGTAPGSR